MQAKDLKPDHAYMVKGSDSAVIVTDVRTNLSPALVHGVQAVVKGGKVATGPGGEPLDMGIQWTGHPHDLAKPAELAD